MFAGWSYIPFIVLYFLSVHDMRTLTLSSAFRLHIMCFTRYCITSHQFLGVIFAIKQETYNQHKWEFTIRTTFYVHLDVLCFNLLVTHIMCIYIVTYIYKMLLQWHFSKGCTTAIAIGDKRMSKLVCIDDKKLSALQGAMALQTTNQFQMWTGVCVCVSSMQLKPWKRLNEWTPTVKILLEFEYVKPQFVNSKFPANFLFEIFSFAIYCKRGKCFSGSVCSIQSKKCHFMEQITWFSSFFIAIGYFREDRIKTYRFNASTYVLFPWKYNSFKFFFLLKCVTNFEPFRSTR